MWMEQTKIYLLHFVCEWIIWFLDWNNMDQFNIRNVIIAIKFYVMPFNDKIIYKYSFFIKKWNKK